MDIQRLLLLWVALLVKGTQSEGTFPEHATSLKLQSWEVELQEVLKEVPGDECRRQVIVVLEGLRNFTDWALRMADATAKLPSGLLRGNLHALGDMDECVAVEAALGSGGAVPIRGKYCLASVHMDSDRAHLTRLLDIATGGRRHLEFRHRVADMGDGWIVASPGFLPEMSRGEWGVCVPAACSAADVEAALHGLARRLQSSIGLQLDVHVPPLMCRTREGPSRPLSTAHYAFLILIGVLVTLAITGTVWDSYNEDQSADASSSYRLMLRAFSLRVGWKRMTSERREEIGCIAGIRGIACLIVLLIHNLFDVVQLPSVNKIKLFELTQNKFFTPFFAAPVLVDMYFVVGATLFSYYLADTIINGKFNYITTMIYRFLRLSPVYYLLILFYTTFLEYLGDGPLWDTSVNYKVQACRESWIWNVLYINNYMNTSNICMVQTWFMASDMQMVVVAPLVMIPLFRWRRGRQLMMAVIVLTVVVVVGILASQRIPSVFNLYESDRNLALYAINLHFRTHVHLLAFLVGLYLGYILHKIKNKTIILNKGYATLGWTLCLLMYGVTLFGPHSSLQENFKYNILFGAIYPTLGRLFGAIATAWIIFACHIGYGGLFNRLLNSYPLLIISRLSYISNIVQFTFLAHTAGRKRLPIWIDGFEIIQTFLSDFSVLMIISMIFFLLLDSPGIVLTRSFLSPGASKKIDESSPVNNVNKNKSN